MATHITADCINCGACEPECPNEAISEGDHLRDRSRALHRVCRLLRSRSLSGRVSGRVLLARSDHVEAEAALMDRAIRFTPTTQS